MTKSHTFKIGTLASAAVAPLALALAFAATPAVAQTGQDPAPTTGASPKTSADGAEAPSDAIVVTGSRIQRKDLTSAAPMTVVSQEEFKLRGSANVESVLNELPSVVPGATAFSNNPGNGVATLNLRNLGAQRTLVLVNGRRYMFFDPTQEVDLNTIPTFLVQNVDVVTGGASAVYGSDAIAGVVNFQLRNLKGFEAGTQYGLTGRGDGARWDSHVAMGGETSDGRGHFTVYGEYYQRKPIFQADRGFSRNTLTDDGDGFAFGGSGTGASGKFRVTDGTAAGTNFGTPNGAIFDTPGGPSRAYQSPSDDYNYAPANYLMLPQKRWLVGGYGDYEISDHVTAYTEISFSNNKVKESLAPTPVTGTFTVDLNNEGQYIDSADLASLQTASAAQVAAGRVDPTTGAPITAGRVVMSINRRANEVGNRIADDERNAFRALLGFKGDITDRLHYDAYYSYAHTRDSQIQYGNVSLSAFQNGLLDGSLDIFGPGAISSTAASDISILAQNQNISTLQVATASVNGELFNLGGGGDDVAFAAGGEYRSTSASFVPDTALSSGDVSGFNAGQATGGGYNVKEGFAELNVPLLANKPFFHKLELHGAGRYSSYSLGGVGDVWTYAGDVKWAPVPDVTFRAQYQHAVRAPNVNELYGGLAQGFPTGSDPCGTTAALEAGNLHDICIATGVPTRILTPTAGNATPNAGLADYQQIQGAFGGNANLSAEKSNSYTLGAVIAPRFLPRFHMTVDYFNIKVKGAITSFGGGVSNILQNCYNQSSATSIYCQQIARNPDSGEIDGSTGVDGTQYVVTALDANAGSLKEEGIDFTADYTQPLNFGLFGSSSKLNMSFLGTYGMKDTTSFQGGFVTKCIGKFGTICGEPHAKFKSTMRVTYLDGPMTASVSWHHLSAVHDDDPSTTYVVERLPAYNTFDVAMSYDVTDNYSLTFGVNNVGDKKPPLIGDNQQQANTYPSTYDVLGRDFFISAGVKF